MIQSKIQEQKHELHHMDWPVFLSAEQRQKLLRSKLQRATEYIRALEICSATKLTENFDARTKVTGSN